MSNSTIEQREDGRAAGEMRKVSITTGVAPAAAGSVRLAIGNTQLICAAMVENAVPRWMRQQKVSGGWVTAEYRLLPYSTAERTPRDSARGRIGGRTHEIQRLIGRSLRAVVNLEILGQRTIWVDCDVLQADGGTRTAAVTGGFLALRLAVDNLLRSGELQADPLRSALAAVSVGMVNGQPVLDMSYSEDFAAEVDLNVAMTAEGRFVEIQGNAEQAPFSPQELDTMLCLAQRGISRLIELQQQSRGATDGSID